jgi:hypothetical protein
MNIEEPLEIYLLYEERKATKHPICLVCDLDYLKELAKKDYEKFGDIGYISLPIADTQNLVETLLSHVYTLGRES